MNADPNYGSAWFHYREQPNLIPTAILTTSLERISKELAATQRLYGRAVLKFVMKCMHSQRTKYQGTSSSKAPLTPSSASSSSEFDSISGSSGGASTSPWRLNQPSGNNPVKFASPVKDSRLSLLQECHSVKDRQEHEAQKARVLELCSDVEIMVSTNSAGLTSPTAKSTASSNREAEKYCAEDFVSGSIELNRELFSQDLSEEMKRKYLFGSDQIIS